MAEERRLADGAERARPGASRPADGRPEKQNARTKRAFAWWRKKDYFLASGGLGGDVGFGLGLLLVGLGLGLGFRCLLVGVGLASSKLLASAFAFFFSAAALSLAAFSSAAAFFLSALAWALAPCRRPSVAWWRQRRGRRRPSGAGSSRHRGAGMRGGEGGSREEGGGQDSEELVHEVDSFQRWDKLAARTGRQQTTHGMPGPLTRHRRSRQLPALAHCRPTRILPSPR